jgi:hemerythrin-like domain-containing protein
MVSVLEALQKRLENGNVDPELLVNIVDFFRTFADKGHHAKEENLLFPTLEKHGVRPHGCPIGTLRLEHKQARTLMTALNDANEKYKNGDSEAKNTIIRLIKNAIDLYKDHIWREDYLLFPMTEKILPQSEQQNLLKSFKQVETTFGTGFHEKYEQLVTKLERVVEIGNKGGV